MCMLWIFFCFEVYFVLFCQTKFFISLRTNLTILEDNVFFFLIVVLTQTGHAHFMFNSWDSSSSFIINKIFLPPFRVNLSLVHSAFIVHHTFWRPWKTSRHSCPSVVVTIQRRAMFCSVAIASLMISDHCWLYAQIAEENFWTLVSLTFIFQTGNNLGNIWKLTDAKCWAFI